MDFFDSGNSSKKIFFAFLLFFIQAVAMAQSVGDYRSSGNVSFNTATNWQVWNGSWGNANTAPSSYSFGSGSLLTVRASDILTVSGAVSISIPKITIIGTVSFANNSFLTVGSSAQWCRFTIDPGGKLDMGNGSDQSTLVLYGNYVNNGVTDFYKSNVIITGDLTSPSTSTLQNNGNVIVGGNIIGDFAITGNDQGPVIYAVNSNATVTITSAVINSGVRPGDQPTGESVFLQNLVKQVIYEGNSTCTFILKDPTKNPSTCVGGSATITIEAILNSTYQWQINIGSTGWSNISGQTSNSLVINNVTASMVGNKYRIKVTNSGCTKNSNYVTFSIDSPTVAGTASANQTVCSGTPLSPLSLSDSIGTIQWQLSTDSVTFSDISGATSSSLTSVQLGVFTGTKYYRAAVTNSGCNTLFSNVITKTVNAAPAITTQPTQPTATCSRTGIQTLTVSATGTNLTYSWRRGGTVLINAGVVSGQGTSTLTLTNSVVADAGSYDVVVSGTCTPAVTSSLVTVTVYAAPAITTQPTAPTATCPGTGIQTLTVSTTGTNLTYSWRRGGTVLINTGVVSGQGTSTLTLTNSVVADAGSYDVVVSGTCTPAVTSSPVTVTVNAAPIAPAFTQVNPTCLVGTGSVSVTSPVSGSTYTLTGITLAVAAQTGTSFATLAAGTYELTQTNATGCISSPTSVTINTFPAVTTTWKGIGLGWDNGVPSVNKKIVFDATYNSIIDFTVPLGIIPGEIPACSCEVKDNVQVTIAIGHTLKVVNEVKISVTGGTLIFENNASLVQINDAVKNSGDITYKRNTPSILNTDYVYWSSPVSTAKLSGIQTSTLYYSFNAEGNAWVRESSGSDMNRGKGYIVRGAGTGLTGGTSVIRNATFTGVPNNGAIPVTIVGAGRNNLIGNPYPSAIDGAAFIRDNSTVIEGTIYFWMHAIKIQLASGIKDGTAGSGAYAYTSNDYSPFNLVGGTNSVTGDIAAGQGFFARGSASGGTATFKNSMRLNPYGEIVNNSSFLKPASGSKTSKAATTKTEKSRIWLNLTNTQGAFKQLLLGYVTGATNNYDRGYDALSLNGNSFINFYSINNSSLLTIQGRALPIEETDAVPLGYSSTVIGDFSISIDKADGVLSNMAVFLEDKLTNTTHNLKNGAYTFTTEKGTFNERFILSYVDKVTLGTDDLEVLESQVVITSKSKEININASANYMDKVFVYDVTGKQIFLKSKIDKNEFIISNLGNIDQVLIVKVLLQNNTIVTKKVTF